MRGVNKAIIVGRLGNDPVVKQFNNGGSVTHISVATSEQWTDKQTGEKREATEWHRISLFNRLGEIAAQYLKKGSSVYIEGSLRTNKYTDQNGVERYSTEIRADQMQMLDSNNMGGNMNNGMNNNQNGGWNNQNNFSNPNNNQSGYNNGYNNNNNGYNPNQNYNNNAQSNNFGGQGGYDNANNNNSNNQSSPNPFMNGNNNQPPAQTSNAPMSTPKPGVVDDDVPFAPLAF